MSTRPPEQYIVRHFQDDDDESYEHEETRATPEPDADESNDRLQQQLDDALEATFPASDPVSIVTSQYEESWSDEPRPGGNTGDPQQRGYNADS